MMIGGMEWRVGFFLMLSSQLQPHDKYDFYLPCWSKVTGTTLHRELIRYDSIQFDSNFDRVHCYCCRCCCSVDTFPFLHLFSYLAVSDVAISQSASPLFPMERGAVVVCCLLLLLFFLSLIIIIVIVLFIKYCCLFLYFVSCCMLLFSLILVVLLSSSSSFRLFVLYVGYNRSLVVLSLLSFYADICVFCFYSNWLRYKYVLPVHTVVFLALALERLIWKLCRAGNGGNLISSEVQLN